MIRKLSFNPKRRIRSNVDQTKMADLANQVSYAGSPYHKRNPAKFGLMSPPEPRLDKSWCEQVNISDLKVAQGLLRDGVLHCLVSEQERGPSRFPQNIWAVTANNEPVEAQLENEVLGTYHGYPMQQADPLAKEVLRKWKSAASS
jgi:hypothetical protein